MGREALDPQRELKCSCAERAANEADGADGGRDMRPDQLEQHFASRRAGFVASEAGGHKQPGKHDNKQVGRTLACRDEWNRRQRW